jgi:hypothetical protein
MIKANAGTQLHSGWKPVTPVNLATLTTLNDSPTPGNRYLTAL